MEVDFGDVRDVPEVIERPWEVDLNYVVKRVYQFCQLRTDDRRSRKGEEDEPQRIFILFR